MEKKLNHSSQIEVNVKERKLKKFQKTQSKQKDWKISSKIYEKEQQKQQKTLLFKLLTVQQGH